MYKFDKEFVHFMWDDVLEEKTVFYADTISELERAAVSNISQNKGTVHNSGSGTFPFEPFEVGDMFRFCYYDPYYDIKLAHEQGKIIQFHELNDDWDEWLDCENEPDWGYPPERYRIKPDEPKPITNSELARWLAQGNGLRDYYGTLDTDWAFCIENTDDAVPSNVTVRKWDDTEWHEPTREYMGLEG